MKVLRLLPYQADLNAIELVWGYVKNHLREMIGSKTKIGEIIEKGYKILSEIDSDTAKKMIDH